MAGQGQLQAGLMYGPMGAIAILYFGRNRSKTCCIKRPFNTAHPLLQNFKPSSIPVMRIELTYIANSWLDIDVGGGSKAVCIIAKLCQLFVKVNLLFQIKVKSLAQVQILTSIMFLAFWSNCGPNNKNCWRHT